MIRLQNFYKKTIKFLSVGFILILLSGCGSDLSGSWILDESKTKISGCYQAFEFEGENQVKVYDSNTKNFNRVYYRKSNLPDHVPLADIMYQMKFPDGWKDVELSITNDELDVRLDSFDSCYYKPWE